MTTAAMNQGAAIPSPAPEVTVVARLNENGIGYWAVYQITARGRRRLASGIRSRKEMPKARGLQALLDLALRWSETHIEDVEALEKRKAKKRS